MKLLRRRSRVSRRVLRVACRCARRALPMTPRYWPDRMCGFDSPCVVQMKGDSCAINRSGRGP
eukprot:2555370-Prymnesium_polylepis.1